MHPYDGTRLQCQSSSDSESARFMVDTLSIFRHHVHGGVRTNEVVLGRERISELPNYGIGVPHADVHEHWVSSCISGRTNLGLIPDREGWNQFMHD